VAARLAPPGDSISGIQNDLEKYVSLGSGSSLARQFLEIPENTIIHEITKSMHSIYHTCHANMNTKTKGTIQLP